MRVQEFKSSRVIVFIVLLSAMLFLVSVVTDLCVCHSSLARDVSIELRPVQQNVNVGDKIAVKVNIDQVSNLKGINILISFDNLRLEYESIVKGAAFALESFVEDIVPDPAICKTTGKIEYLAALEAVGPGIESSGETILTLNFIARSPGEAWIKLNPNEISLADSMANAIPATMDGERHTIQIGQIFRLKRVFNYPNPAREGKTVIRCEALALLTELEAKIYDVSGELVKIINYEDFDDSNAPVYEYTWDCKNEDGHNVANGTYILWLKATLGSDEKYETWKIAVLR